MNAIDVKMKAEYWKCFTSTKVLITLKKLYIV